VSEISVIQSAQAQDFRTVLIMGLFGDGMVLSLNNVPAPQEAYQTTRAPLVKQSRQQVTPPE